MELTKIFSRERGVWYGFLWNESDRIGYRKYLSYEVKNNLILREGRLTVWYEQHELDAIHTHIVETFTNNTKLFKELVLNLRTDWAQVLPILSRKTKITVSTELQNYYQHLGSFWASMNILYTLPSLAGVTKELQDEALAVRSEAEKYSSNMELIWIKYWAVHKPEYAVIANHMTPTEAFQAAESGLSTEEITDIKTREAGSFLFNGKLYLAIELDAVLASNGLTLPKEDTESPTELKGTTAYKGKVRGRVRIISLRKDIPTMQEGEVLVTEMTDPEYLPAVRKAVAVVTDEGGITCHVAITARELKKPTITGTKIATQVFRDGDMVEVDADNGVVRELK